ncbi:MAG: SocA family protein [Myroides sp.]|nr:SocA family protein [Myroides sp.]
MKELNEKSDLHKVMKILYFSDREHLVKYGFPITGDTYFKMKFGPVPSFMNYVATNDHNDEKYRGIITKKNKYLTSNVDIDIEDLSKSEITCLENSIITYSKYNFKQLTEISHKDAWNKSDWEINYFDIAKEGGAEEDMLKYIKERAINESISFNL